MSAIKVEGTNQLIANFKRLEKEYGAGIAKAGFMGGQIVRNKAVKSIQAKSNGQTVTRSRNGGGTYSHVASKVGDAPNTDTGDLVKSVAVEVGADVVRVGTNQKHGKHLEFGTNKMGARPWLLPALKASSKQINNLYRKAMVSVTLRGGSKK